MLLDWRFQRKSVHWMLGVRVSKVTLSHLLQFWTHNHYPRRSYRSSFTSTERISRAALILFVSLSPFEVRLINFSFGLQRLRLAPPLNFQLPACFTFSLLFTQTAVSQSHIWFIDHVPSSQCQKSTPDLRPPEAGVRIEAAEVALAEGDLVAAGSQPTTQTLIRHKLKTLPKIKANWAK